MKNRIDLCMRIITTATTTMSDSTAAKHQQHQQLTIHWLAVFICQMSNVKKQWLLLFSVIILPSLFQQFSRLPSYPSSANPQPYKFQFWVSLNAKYIPPSTSHNHNTDLTAVLSYHYHIGCDTASCNLLVLQMMQSFMKTDNIIQK